MGWAATLNAVEASLKGGILTEIGQKQVNMHAKAIIFVLFCFSLLDQGSI